jgi:MFS family permease
MDQVPQLEPHSEPPTGGVRILRPLRIRDFGLLFWGTTVSQFGDGVYLVAIAWQVYELSNAPTALSIVGVAWTLPMVMFLLVGGVMGDRFDRRRLMIFGDVLRAAAIGVIAVLAFTDALELWHLVVLVGFYGAGEAIFAPNFQAVIPDVVPQRLIVQANSLQQLAEPIGYRFAGPAVGGVLVAGFGTGTAFALDAATFGVSAICIALMRPLPMLRSEAPPSVIEDIREGARFVRQNTWLWATLCMAALSLLAFIGPFEVLIPFIVKNQLGGDAGTLGVVFGAAGVGAVCASLVLGQRGIGHRHVLTMYVAWGMSTLSLIGFALASAAWQMVVIAFYDGLCATIGLVIWVTLMHRHVPGELLGRVSALDWLVSIGLTPVSFALAGPVAEAIGTDATLIGAGVLASIATFSFLAVPGLRAPERWKAEPEPAPAPAR